jgi:murein L,D-transpeptidase YcbB/YkuD
VDIAALEQVRQIERTLERWRWLPRTLERGAILVNIPEFRLKALDQNLDTTLDMKVIVGLTKHPTPLFTANLQYVVFGPYWNVPKSILLNELVPDIVKDRTYLARNAYEVVNAGGQVVSTGEVSDEVLAGLKSGTLRVRQVPGPKNALGRVKFLFPNENDVYLHDTPSRNLFGRDQRALSHGCVRVENPEALAQWVLRGETDWSQERIAAGLKQTKPLQANLQQAIPVFMLYHTVTVGEDGEVHFWKDLYKQDAALAAKIAVTTGEPGQRPRE